MARVTAKDVARAAGVDPSTVSRVLNGPGGSHRYDPATAARIREAAERLGYSPSPTARALRTGRSSLLGLVVSDIADPFFAELAAQVERRVSERSYRLVVCSTDERPERQQALLQELILRGVDGLIVSPAGPAGIRDVLESGAPLVTIDRPLRGMPVAHVGLDDLEAGRMLGEHLRAAGHTRAGVVVPAMGHDPSLQLRLRGLRMGLGSGGAVVWRVSWPRTVGRLAVVEMIREHLKADRPDVVVGMNSASSLAILQAIVALPIRMPDDLAVAGIDDFPAAAFVNPPVTVVAQPIEAIAHRAVWMLLDRPAAEEGGQVSLLPPLLIERASTPHVGFLSS